MVTTGMCLHQAAVDITILRVLRVVGMAGQPQAPPAVTITDRPISWPVAGFSKGADKVRLLVGLFHLCIKKTRAIVGQNVVMNNILVPKSLMLPASNMRILSAVVFAALTLSLGGCLSLGIGPKVQLASFVQPTRIIEPQPSQSIQDHNLQSLDLNDLLEIARRNNPGLAIGAFDVQTARAQRNVVAAERWPQVSNVDSLRQYVQNQRLQAARLNGEPGMFSSGILAVDIVVRMPIFTGGRIRNEIGAADLASLAVDNKLARTWEELIFNVSSAYYTILGQRKVLESLNFSREVLTKHNRRVEDLMSVGKAARVDVLRTEVRIADLDQRLERERNVLEIQRRVLTSLIGAPLTREPVKVQGSLNLGPQQLDLSSAMPMAFSQRGDYRASRASLEAQALKVRASTGALWPRVSMDGAIGMRSATGIDDNGVAYTRRLNITTKRSADTPSNNNNYLATPLLREPWSNPDSTLPVGSLGVVVDYPIFDGGRIRSQISEQESRFASLQQQLRKLELQIRQEVEIALLNVSSSRRRADATRKAIEQSKESVRIEIQKFDLGKGSITDVLDAQSAMLEAETTHYRALSDYNIALAQLDMATGQKR